MEQLSLKLRLDLSRHCIETEIKRLHNRSVTQYFNSKKDKHQLETRIEVMKNALESFDFPYLRSRYPLLSGGHGEDVFLVVDPNGDTCIITPEEVIQL